MVDQRRIGHSGERAADYAAQWHRRRPGGSRAEQRNRAAHPGDGVIRAERWCGRDILATRAVITGCGNAQPFRSSKSEAFGDGLSARAED